MNNIHGAALETALAYHRSWTSHDFETAMSCVADDITCDAPAGQLQGATAFRGFMAPFVETVTATELLAGYGDDEQAVLVYQTHTVLVADAPGAEWLTVRNGRITHMRIIFDRLPFTAASRPG